MFYTLTQLDPKTHKPLGPITLDLTGARIHPVEEHRVNYPAPGVERGTSRVFRITWANDKEGIKCPAEERQDLIAFLRAAEFPSSPTYKQTHLPRRDLGCDNGNAP